MAIIEEFISNHKYKDKVPKKEIREANNLSWEFYTLSEDLLRLSHSASRAGRMIHIQRYEQYRKHKTKIKKLKSKLQAKDIDNKALKNAIKEKAKEKAPRIEKALSNKKASNDKRIKH